MGVAPSPKLAVSLIVAYVAVVFTLQGTSGITYDEWFDTADNALRAGVIPLGVGTVMILVFMVCARWDFLWRDPERLPVTLWMWLTLAVGGAAILLQFAGTTWSDVPARLIVMILIVGVLVGFAEEMLFRGLLLRSLRDGRRSEASAALWTAIGFGLFHLPNTLLGTGLLGITQFFTAGIMGFGLYFLRRTRGLILVAMIFHGCWDTSLFFSSTYGEGTLDTLGSFLAGLIYVPVIIGAIVLVRRDRALIVPVSGRESGS